MSRSTSSAVRFRPFQTESGGRISKPQRLLDDRPSVVAVASMIVPIAPHQLTDREDHDAHLLRLEASESSRTLSSTKRPSLRYLLRATKCVVDEVLPNSSTVITTCFNLNP